MQNESFLDGVQSPTIQPSIGFTAPTPQGSAALDVPPVPEPRVLPAVNTPVRQHSQKRWLLLVLGVGILLALIGGAFVVLNTRSSSQLQVQSGEYNTVQIPLGGLTVSNTLGEQTTKSLKINGQLFVSGSLVLTPSTQPKNALAGQLYYDKTSNQLSYYNGTQFVNVGAGQSNGGAASTTNNTTNVTNLFAASGSGVQLQADTPGIQQFGNFNVSGTGQVGALQTTTITSPGVLSATSVGDMSVATTAGTGVTGNISIKSGDSSTTASGNITIDAGNGIIDGEIIEDKTFESGLDGMENWFNTTVATTTEQAHSGVQSLKMTPSSNFWGIIEQLPGTPVIAGHQYHFSLWVRAAVAGQTVGGLVVWSGGAGGTTAFTSVVDNTTGWTEVSLTAPAPAGATSVTIRLQSSTGVAGQAHYFDDITVTDLSSSSAFSSIDIGTTNAKVITIGNMNQIGATSILGSSGVTINGGAGNLTMTGGVVNLTGNGASTISTSAGALTITSADAASWGIGTSSTGAGGALTLHGGAGAFGNNDGGDLLLQGGNSSGTGIAGSVIVKSQTNAADSFQVQTTAGTSFFTADSINQIITAKDFNAGSATNIGSSGRVYSDGFESGGFTMWSGGTAATGSSTVTTDSATVRNGKYSGHINQASGLAYAETAFSSSSTTLSMRAYVYVASQGPNNMRIMSLAASSGGAPIIAYRDQATGKLAWEINNVSVIPSGSNAVMSTGAWHKIELLTTINAATGTADLYLDGVNVMSQTGLNTGTAPDRFRIGDPNVRTNDFYLDDLVIDTGLTGDSSSLSVADSFHVSGNATFSGSTLLRSTSDSTTAFRVQNAAGTLDVLNVNTINGWVGIGTATPTAHLSFSAGSDQFVNVNPSTSGAGKNLTIQAGNGAAGSGGGNLILQGGNGTGAGSVIVKPLSDTTNAFQIQNSVSTALFTADTTSMIITIAGTDASYAKLTLANAHFGSTQTTPPTIGTPASCGTTPAAAVTAGSTDNAGSFTITTGTGGTSSACDTVFTFNKPFGATPKSIIVVGNSDALSVARQVYVSNSNATTFTVRFATSAAGANNQMYSFNYWVVE